MNYFFQQLIDEGYKIAVASNSIRNTVKIILLKLGILEFVDIFVSNEDVWYEISHSQKCTGNV